MNVQHGYVSFRSLCALGFMAPSVESTCLRMAMQIENFHDTFPNRLAFEYLFHRHALNVRCIYTVQTPNYIFQFFDVRHFRPRECFRSESSRTLRCASISSI